MERHIISFSFPFSLPYRLMLWSVITYICLSCHCLTFSHNYIHNLNLENMPNIKYYYSYFTVIHVSS